MTYFIVIPIIPAKKLPAIVIAIVIPVFAFSLALHKQETPIPRDNPAKEPANDKKIILSNL